MEVAGEAQATASMDEGVERALQAMGWALAAFYALLSVFWALALRPAYPLLAAAWGSSTVLLTGLTLAASLDTGQAARRLLGGTMGGIVVADSLLLLGVTRDPGMSVALYITVLGFGLILASRFALVLIVATSMGGWTLVAVLKGDASWSSRGIALAGCCVVAVIAQTVRIRLHHRLEVAARREIEAVREAELQQRVRVEMETKTAFVRLAAHELATPLTTITIQARALTKAPLPVAQRRAADLLERNVQRLNRLVRDIITMTQYQAGLARGAPTRVELGALLREQIDAVGRAFGGPVEATVSQAAPVQVHADPERLGDAVGRLLDNAVRFGGTPPRIEIQVGAAHGQGTVRIRDCGPGLPAAKVEELFRPFTVDPQEGRAPHGAGLGLAIARLHIESMGGRLEYEAANPGAAFTIHLPMGAPPMAEA